MLQVQNWLFTTDFFGLQSLKHLSSGWLFIEEFAVSWSVVQSLSFVQLFATPWTAAHQASLSFTIARKLLKLMSIELVMPSNHLILVIPFSCLQSFPASRPFLISQFFTWGGQSIGVSASASVLPMNTQDWSPLGWTSWISLQSKRTLNSLLECHSSKASILQPSAMFTVQLSHLYMTTGKTTALTRWIFVGKVMSLFLNMVSRFVIAFLPRNKCLLISPSVVILEPKKIKSISVSIVSPSICYEVMGLDAMIFVLWMLSFKTAFSLLSHLHQEAL